ncbi:uncharacterized protein LOC131603945 [Vicia villosa]|uniref:uncharacterized protein LOC131603945 n=1 Tax=Vicia villosa TaxID=3911 RepID=UPI00273C1CEA|nr:uncharacterized protein LOC131603945 [Vicia villosa]
MIEECHRAYLVPLVIRLLVPKVRKLKGLSSRKIQKRVKALLLFRNVISTHKLSEFITEKVFMRIFFNMLFDEKEGKADHMKTACIETIASVAGQMGWKSYYALLNKCFQGASRSSDNNKLFIRLICSILDKFHFSELSHTEEPKKSLVGASDMDTDIQTCLYPFVLIKKQLVRYSHDATIFCQNIKP